MSTPLTKHAMPDSLIISYLTLRKVVGLLGILLVPVLVCGSLILDEVKSIEISVSAYYHTDMRNALVGIVCGISLFLLSYNGYSRIDSIASKTAGLFALGIAFFPTSDSGDKSDIISTLHYITSGIFFVTLALMSIFLFTKSSGNMTPEKKKRNRIYRICGIIMLVTVAGIPIGGIDGIYEHVHRFKPTLIFEAAALIAFGFSWITKGEFLLKDK